MSDFTTAELFLGTWAILSTVFAGYCWGRAKHLYMAHAKISVLVAELACGDIKAVTRPDGFTVVENDEMRLSFKKRNKND